MKFLVHIGGAQDGFYTAVAGEQRYAYNLAEALALAGHEVHCVGAGGGGHEGPQWGKQTPIKNITFLHSTQVDPNLLYDASLNTPWEFQWHDGVSSTPWKSCMELSKYVKARLFLHNTFSWNPSHEVNIHCFDEQPRHVLTHPYPPTGSGDYVADRATLRLLPFAYYNETRPLDLPNRNNFVWTCKDVFSDNWTEDKDIHDQGRRILLAVKEVANRHDAHCLFVSGASLFSARAKKFGIPEIINSLKHKRVVDGLLTRNELFDEMAKARVVPILRGYAGGCFDAVAAGALPLFYGGGFSTLFPPTPRLTDDLSVDDMVQLMDALFTDDTLYDGVMETYRKKLKLYSYDSVLEHLSKITEEFLGEKL